MEITQEMRDAFITRTKQHIYRVVKFADKLKLDVLDHDQSKFDEPEMTPYILINWRYKLKDEGVDLQFPPEIDNQLNQATLHHIKFNKHHPEYWDKEVTMKNLNQKDRDAVPEKMVDATQMPRRAIQEMCCDWCAMSEERNNSPYEWADKVIGTRFKFTPHQIFLIYSTLDSLWEPEKGTQSC